jgi:hypothetical protein
MPNEPHEQEQQTTLWKSDDRIVPLKREDQSRGSKPGNAGAGKADRPSRDSDIPPTAPSGGSSVLERLDRITQRAETHPEETFNNLFSLFTHELLWYAFRKLQRDYGNKPYHIELGPDKYPRILEAGKRIRVFATRQATMCSSGEERLSGCG